MRQSSRSRVETGMRSGSGLRAVARLEKSYRWMGVARRYPGIDLEKHSEGVVLQQAIVAFVHVRVSKIGSLRSGNSVVKASSPGTAGWHHLAHPHYLARTSAMYTRTGSPSSASGLLVWLRLRSSQKPLPCFEVVPMSLQHDWVPAM
jgi:hypothetical protein